MRHTGIVGLDGKPLVADEDTLLYGGINSTIKLDRIQSTATALAELMESNPYNPSELISRKGYDTVEEMDRDTEISSLIGMKLEMRTSTPLNVEPADPDDPFSVEVADFTRWALDHIGSISEMTKKNLRHISKAFMHNAMEYGHAEAEIDYRVVNRGKYAGMIAWKNWAVRSSRYFNFQIDEHGDLLKDGFTQEDITTQPIPLDISKFIVYSHNPRNGNPYGETDYLPVYLPWWCKKMISKFHLFSMEKFGTPTPIGTYPKGMDEQSKQVVALKKVLATIQQASNIVIPEGFEIKLLEMTKRSAGGSKTAYLQAIDSCNEDIRKGLLKFDREALININVGGYAQAKQIAQLFFLVLKSFGEDIAQLWTDQPVTRLLVLNYGEKVYDHIPKLVYAELLEEDKKLLIELVEKLIDKGVVNPEENWIRDRLGVPPKPEVITTGDDIEGGDGEVIESIPEEGKPDITPDEEETPPDTEIGNESPNDGEDGRGFARVEMPKTYISRMDYKKVERQLDTLEMEGIAEAVGYFVDMRDALIEQVRKKKIIERKDWKGIQTLAYSAGPLKKILIRNARAVLISGIVDCAEEIKRAGIDVKQFSRHDFAVVFDTNIQSNQEALATIMQMEPSFKTVEGDLVSAFNGTEKMARSRAFTVAGVENKAVLSRAQILLQEVLEQEGGIADYDRLMKDGLVKYTGEAYGQNLAGQPIRPYHTANVFRTNSSTFYNQGKDIWGVTPIIEGWEYAAVLDVRTTDVCEMCDGLQFPKKHSFWGMYTPPNHYQCRSTKIPIVIGEDIAQAESTRNLNNNIQPQEGFSLSDTPGNTGPGIIPGKK